MSSIQSRRTKPTAIPWIGVPEHWEVRKFKFGVTQTYGGGTPHTETPEYWKGDIHWVTAKDVKTDRLFLTEIQITEEGLKNSSASMVPEGTVVLVTRSGILKHTLPAAVCMQAMAINQEMRAIVPKASLSSDYLLYYFKGLNNILSELTRKIGATVESIDMDVLFNMECIFPPLSEQTHVARYLDHKTALIDAFLARKRRTIALLKEHRQALISHAVSKELDPTVAMKDSGIEWIGEVPEHWSVPRIGHQCRIVRGSTPRPAGDPRYFNGTDMPWITVGEVTRAQGKYIESTEVFLTAEGVQYSRIVEPETLLLSNSGATLGVPRITRIQGCINDGSVAFLDLNNGLLRDYLYYFFESHTSIYRSETQGSGQPDLNTDIIGGTCIALPPNSEQGAIIAHLDTKTSEIEEGLTRIEASRERMREYRQALISAVVSWKVDVTAAAKALAAEVGVQLADELMGQIVGGALV